MSERGCPGCQHHIKAGVYGCSMCGYHLEDAPNMNRRISMLEERVQAIINSITNPNSPNSNNNTETREP